MKRLAAVASIAAICVVLVLALSATEAGQLLLGRWSFTKSVEVDRGTYFRLRVKVAYKAEPQDFDIVVGCNVRWTTYKDNSRTYEAGLVPTLFGRRMSDGTALVVRPPNACHGETTANGGVPPDFIPVMVVYDDADTMGFGTAYLTEDAYHSPLAVLAYGGATIEAATRADFEAFRSSAPNAVRPEMYFADSPPELKRRNLGTPAMMFADSCHAYARFRLTGEQRAAAQRYWPDDHPQYWRPKTETEKGEIDGGLSAAQLLQSDSATVSHPRPQLMFGLDAEVADYGVPTQDGKGLLRAKAVYPASVYPDLGPWGHRPRSFDLYAAALDALGNGPRIRASIEFRQGATKGFAYCWSDPAWYVEHSPVAEEPGKATVDAYNSLQSVEFVDGVTVVAPAHKDQAFFIVERDEFVFRRVLISLDSTRGDV